MSRDVFVDVHDLSTYVEIRNRLQTRFMHASIVRSMELKVALLVLRIVILRLWMFICVRLRLLLILWLLFSGVILLIFGKLCL